MTLSDTPAYFSVRDVHADYGESYIVQGVSFEINEGEILKMIALRNNAREDRNYKEADIIRDKLLDKGVLIEDKDGKTIWKIK